MKIKDVRVGQKLKIAREPKQNHYGHGKVGLTFVVSKITNNLIYSPDLSKDYPTFACISPEFVEPVDFTKSDLKTGMRVQYRNGTERVVVGEDLFNGGCVPAWQISIVGYDSSLEHPTNQMTIMKVWAAPDKCEDFFNLEAKGALLFERVEPPVKTQQELEYEQLMAKIEELKQQAEKFKPEA